MDEHDDPFYRFDPTDEDDDFNGFESPAASTHRQDMEQSHESPPHLRSQRSRKPPKRLIKDPNFLSICDTALISRDFIEPTSYEEATLSPQAEEWKAVMQEEIDSLATHGTWRLEKLPRDRRTIKNKWLFKIKPDAEGNSTRFKARLVAKGFFLKRKNRLWSNLRSSCPAWVSSYNFGGSCCTGPRDDATRRENGVIIRWPHRRNLYGSTRRLLLTQPTHRCLQTTEEMAFLSSLDLFGAILILVCIFAKKTREFLSWPFGSTMVCYVELANKDYPKSLTTCVTN